jgi:hypothetical protein
MQQPGILQPAEPDSLSIGHRRFTEAPVQDQNRSSGVVRRPMSLRWRGEDIGHADTQHGTHCLQPYIGPYRRIPVRSAGICSICAH